LCTFQHLFPLLAKFMKHSLKIQAWACCLIVEFLTNYLPFGLFRKITKNDY